LIGIVTRSYLLTVFLRSDEDLLVAVQEGIAAVHDAPSRTISATTTASWCCTGRHRSQPG
jgi:hypothetical protein